MEFDSPFICLIMAIQQLGSFSPLFRWPEGVIWHDLHCIELLGSGLVKDSGFILLDDMLGDPGMLCYRLPSVWLPLNDLSNVDLPTIRIPIENFGDLPLGEETNDSASTIGYNKNNINLFPLGKLVFVMYVGHCQSSSSKVHQQ